MELNTKNILQKFSKQKVELSAIDDLESVFKDAYSLTKKSSVLNQVQSSLDKAYDKYQLVRRSADGYIKSAKELGADDMVKRLNKIQSEADAEMRKILKALSSIEDAVRLIS